MESRQRGQVVDDRVLVFSEQAAFEDFFCIEVLPEIVQDTFFIGRIVEAEEKQIAPVFPIVVAFFRIHGCVHRVLQGRVAGEILVDAFDGHRSHLRNVNVQLFVYRRFVAEESPGCTFRDDNAVGLVQRLCVAFQHVEMKDLHDFGRNAPDIFIVVHLFSVLLHIEQEVV